MIYIEGLVKKFSDGVQTRCILDELSAQFETGSFNTIQGVSGSGKSTFLNIIGCLDRFDAGHITIHGHDISRLNDAQLSNFRHQHIGFVFQDFNLIPHLTAYENIEFPLRFSSLRFSEMKAIVHDRLKQVDMYQYRHLKPGQLSGGQKQRVAIVRALINKPSIILADEPTANLDPAATKNTMQLLKQLSEEDNVTCLIITHDDLVCQFAQRRYQLQNGKL